MGFPWARYYDLAHGNPISDTHIERDFGDAAARGFLRPPRRGVPNHEPEPLGEFEGACPLMHAPPRAAKPQARSDPKSRRTDSATLSARPLFRR